MKTTSILATILVALTLSVPNTQAADNGKKTTDKPAAAATTAPAKEMPKSDAKKDHYPLYGQLVSITATTLTIKGGEGKPDRIFNITKDTTIKKDDKAATVKDAKEGQWVGGYVKRNSGNGNDELVSLNLSAKQKDAGAAMKKPEAMTPPKKK